MNEVIDGMDEYETGIGAGGRESEAGSESDKRQRGKRHSAGV